MPGQDEKEASTYSSTTVETTLNQESVHRDWAMAYAGSAGLKLDAGGSSSLTCRPTHRRRTRKPTDWLLQSVARFSRDQRSFWPQVGVIDSSWTPFAIHVAPRCGRELFEINAMATPLS